GGRRPARLDRLLGGAPRPVGGGEGAGAGAPRPRRPRGRGEGGGVGAGGAGGGFSGRVFGGGGAVQAAVGGRGLGRAAGARGAPCSSQGGAGAGGAPAVSAMAARQVKSWRLRRSVRSASRARSPFSSLPKRWPQPVTSSSSPASPPKPPALQGDLSPFGPS